MAVFKQEKTKDGRCWFFMIRYTDLLGNRKQKKSHKFLTKKEAQDAERAFLIKLEKGETISDMTFKELIFLKNSLVHILIREIFCVAIVIILGFNGEPKRRISVIMITEASFFGDVIYGA